jgi:hypothetical protein
MKPKTRKKTKFKAKLVTHGTKVPDEVMATTSFDPDSIPVIEDEDSEVLQIDNPTQEMLFWHYHLGHLPFSRIQSMAKAGDFPKRLATCRIPECPMCRFGKATKVPWRTKGKQNNNIKIIPVTAPGQCVSVDQLESTTPGLIAQLKGTPTKLRYRYVTVFVDHYSGLSFVYRYGTIMPTMDALQTTCSSKL